MIKFLGTPIARAGMVTAASATVLALWLVYDLPIAILPALLAGMWIPLFARGKKQPSPAERRLLTLLTALGLVAFLALMIIYFLVR